MRISLLNPPWCHPDNDLLWGVRAGSRWPHFQRRPSPGRLPRYLPFPFFLAIAARVLQDTGHDVQLIDGVAEGETVEVFRERVLTFEPDFVFAELSTPSLDWDCELLSSLRAELPGIPFAGGGTLDKSLARVAIERAAIDFWLAGEYEDTLPQAAKAIGAGQTLCDLPGLIDGAHEQSPRTISNVDSLPLPLHEQLPMLNYIDPVCGLPQPSLQTWLSRGCPYSCNFCVWPQIVYHGRDYRKRSVPRVLDEIETMFSLYPFESFYFDDDTANIGEKRMLDLAAGLKERGLDQYPWAMMARGDCMNRKMIDALADAGMYSIKYGVESISQKLTNACSKGTSIPRLIEAIEHSKSCGVKVHLTFTFGLPGETLETIQETMDFARSIDPETAQFSLCTPFPGTRFYDECVENGYLVTDDWRHFLGSGQAVVSTPELSADELQAAHKEALRNWESFNRAKLQRRKQRLLDRLREQLPNGSGWRFIGDRGFADFLFADEQLAAAEHDESELLVIVSRHNEEKLYRQLKREGHAGNVLRLFTD